MIPRFLNYCDEFLFVFELFIIIIIFHLMNQVSKLLYEPLSFVEMHLVLSSMLISLFSIDFTAVV